MVNHPSGLVWKVGFRNQTNSVQSDKDQSILLNNECLTTSGNDSCERKHIISPWSGQPLEGVRQVAVVTNDGTTGEVLSTSLFVANQEKRKVLTAEFLPSIIIDL